MPYINSKVSVKMSEDKRETVKKKLGEAISIIPGKSENWLMVSFEDECDLYFQGNKNEATAFVEVNIYGSANRSVYDKMTSVISDILNDELQIPKNRIYIRYEEFENWGWNGSNF